MAVLNDKEVMDGQVAITVNSSPYAVEAYRRLGFVNTDTEQLTNGIRYYSMTHTLKEKSVFTADELAEARRALLSLRNKNDKAAGKLKEDTWQNRLTTAVVKAADVALGLIGGSDSVLLEKSSLDESHAALTDALRRAESVIGKFTVGTSYHTLQKNRIAALKVALALIEKEQSQQ